jgi:hypothetical protein
MITGGIYFSFRAILHIYNIALETYHIGNLLLWTLILFIGFGLILFGYRIIRRKKKARVKTAYTSAYPDPLKLDKGQILSIGQKESDWSGWLWCTDHNNISGWVPESYIRIEENEAVMLCDYDATEMTVRPGDQLIIINEESGWYLCLDQKGNKGWVPKENFE